MKHTTIDKIKSLHKLPQLPQTTLKLLEICDQDETDLDQMVKIISSDAALTANLMQILNSAWVNMNKDIQSVESAVIFLGIETIRNLAISMSVLHIFGSDKSLHNFNLQAFWYHSFKCALLARKISKITHLVNPEEAFFTGLIHDIGKLVLMQNYPEVYSKLIKETQDDQELAKLELNYFNLTYADVGSWLCQQWHFSPKISDAILYLNDTIERIEYAAFPLVKIIYAVNFFCSLTDRKDDMSAQEDELYSKALSLVGIAPDILESTMVDVESEVLSMAESLGIKFTDTSVSDIAVELTNKELENKIRDYSLVYGTLENLFRASDTLSVLNSLETGLKIIFRVSRIFFFLCDDENKLLKGYCSNRNRKDRIINSIAISMANKESLLIKSLTNRQILNGSNRDTEKSLAISDSQIIRLLECDVMFAIPMYLNEKNIGVIVIGGNPDNVPVLIQNSGMVAMIAKLAAVAVDHNRYRNNNEQLILKERASAASDSMRKVIHEINNPLMIITSYLKMLTVKLPENHPAQQELHVIDEEIERIGGLVKELSLFSNPTISQFEWIDVNKLFCNMLEVIKKSILLPKGIDATIVAEPDFPLVKTDKNSLKQIFINLLKNASEAMEHGGKIYIGLKQVSGSVKIVIDEKRKTSGQIEIVIRDTGPGIPDEILQRIFEPYNSSKKGKNSGLGLSIVNTIVRNINGSIECRTKKNVGTEFKITLPVSSDIPNIHNEKNDIAKKVQNAALI